MNPSSDAYSEAVRFLDELAQQPDQKGRVQAVMRQFASIKGTSQRSTSAVFKARQSTEALSVAPDHVDGPNGFSVQCYAARDTADALNALFALRAAPPSSEPEYGPCSCQDSGKCRYVNGGPACMNEKPSNDARAVEHKLHDVLKTFDSGEHWKLREQIKEAIDVCHSITMSSLQNDTAKPLDMLLFCPRCQMQHVDAPEPEKGWTNPPHATHTCQHCGLLWRPSNENTNGVAEIACQEPKHAARISASFPPEGMVLMPVEPTPEMVLKGRQAIETSSAGGLGSTRQAYLAMLAAAPSPSVNEESK